MYCKSDNLSVEFSSVQALHVDRKMNFKIRQNVNKRSFHLACFNSSFEIDFSIGY